MTYAQTDAIHAARGACVVKAGTAAGGEDLETCDLR